MRNAAVKPGHASEKEPAASLAASDGAFSSASRTARRRPFRHALKYGGFFCRPLILAGLAVPSGAASVLAQPVPPVIIAGPALNFATLDFGSNSTFLTGIRGNTITGQYVIPGGGTGGLIWSTTTQAWTPFPVATTSGVNFPGAIDNTPYGPSFGSYGGILRTVGSYQTQASAPYDLGYLYDGSTASKLLTLQYPTAPGAAPLFTIPHSTFGNQVVGNYDTQFATGHAFLYNIATGTYANIDKPGAVSTTAYGVWGDKIAGGYAAPGDGPGVTHGYIYNQTTGVYTSYDHPGALITHFEGIAGAGRAGTYNLVADWVGIDGIPRASVLHIDAQGNQTWIDYNVPGAAVTSANSMYQGTALGIYVDSTGGTHGYTVNIPGIYNPIHNIGTLTTSAPNAPAITGAPGDDVLNDGTISTSGANSPGVRADTYGVITNNGGITVSGPGSAAVQMNGLFGTLLNWGKLAAAPGADAIGTGPTASGTLVVNYGTIDGRVDVSAGPFARFENSGWLGITAPGSGTTHLVTGTFVQTDAGTLQLRVAANGSHDALQVVGTAQIAGSLALAPQPGLYANQTVYAGAVSATGELRGTFGTVTTPSPFLQASLLPGSDSIGVVMTRLPFDAFPGLTPNQRYSQALSTGAGAGLYGQLLGTTVPAGAVPAAYDALSGEGVTGSQQTMFMISSAFVNAIRDQGALWLSGESPDAGGLASNGAPIRPGSWRGWVSGDGGAGHLGSDYSMGAARLSFGTWGGLAGIDYAVSPNILVGVAMGGSGGSFSVSDRQTDGTVNGGEGGVYALGRWSGLYASGTLAYGRYNVGTTRTISGLGLTAVSNGSFDAGVLTGRVEGGYIIRTSLANLNVTPVIAYQPSWISQPGFSEAVSASYAPVGLAFQGKTATSQPISLGLQVDRTFALGGEWTLAPTARAAWVHEFSTERSLSASLLQAPSAAWQVYGAPAARDSALLIGTLYAAHGQRLALFSTINAGLSGPSLALGGYVGVRLTL